MPVGKTLGSDELCPHVAVANCLEKIAIPQNRAIFHIGWLFFCYVFNGNCNHLHQKDAFHFLSRAWNYNKYNMSLGDIFYFASSDVRKLDLRLTEGKKA